jgi:hypothetical protein
MAIDQSERDRRRKLLKAHLDAENAHDVPAIMKTFAEDGEMIFNSSSFKGFDVILQAHEGFGWSSSKPGSLEGARVLVDKEHFTDDEIIIEGRVVGKHAGDFGGLPPTNAEVSLPFVTVYRFNAAGKLTYERIVMNVAPFGKPEGDR